MAGEISNFILATSSMRTIRKVKVVVQRGSLIIVGIPCKFGKKCKFVERCSFCNAPDHGIHMCPKVEAKKPSNTEVKWSNENDK